MFTENAEICIFGINQKIAMITKVNILRERFSKTRQHSEHICEPLEIEDFVVQPIDFASPPKWHLAHTTWFFEEFVLRKNKEDYKLFDEHFAYLFNSYYESVGDHWMRTDRGNLSRPSVNKIKAYRHYVTQAMEEFMKEEISSELQDVIEIGINHEQQHQELLLTDIKYILGNNPLFPIYNKEFEENLIEDFKPKWIDFQEGVYEIGLSEEDKGFRYDNEMGKHKVYLHDFSISNKLVTNGEFLEFMNDGGYDQVLLWHSDGWAWLENSQIKAPLYWYKIKGEWHQYTLSGLQKLNLDAPLSHISYYEAFAFAQWKGMRLPTEAEWEIAQAKFEWGTRWEFTGSAYLPYPNYQKPEGAIGEYNGKFMVNQKVLRGSSVATSEGHARPTYRNFFHPEMRWQFFGVRLAK